MIILVIIIFLIIYLIDYPELIYKKRWHDVKVLSIFFVSAFILAVLFVFEVQIPSPIKGAQFIIQDVLHLKFT